MAVPGATSFDPDAATTTASNLLTTLILGGKTQVRKALDAGPTFATVWIGNNDVLAPALSGLPSTATPQTTFQTNYDKMLTDLSAPNLKGVLIGVVNVTSAPALFPVSLLINSVPFRTAFDQAAGFNAASTDPFKSQPLNIEANCTASQTTLVSFLIVPQIAAFRNDSTRAPTARSGHPPDISCGTSSIYPAPVGDVFILTPAEVTTLTNTVDSYNAYISGKATAIGWGYLNPNAILDSLKNRVTPSQITPGPNFASATAPFGKWISLDGVHPSSAAHQLITNYLIEVINGKYATSLVKLPNP